MAHHDKLSIILIGFIELYDNGDQILYFWDIWYGLDYVPFS